MNNRLKSQLDFIIEIDKIKHIKRKTSLFNGSRVENDAEHSWHISIMALVLKEYANDEIDVLRVLKMLLMHDLVEIDAGDTFLYSGKRQNVKKSETEAAKRIFGILPEEQKNEYLELWKEFEEKETKDARFAAVLDRLEPILQNYITHGKTWQEFNIKLEQVVNANKHIKNGSVTLWDYVENILKESVEKGFLKE